MGIFSMCPACGSDWCSGCECVKEKLAAAEAAIVTMTKERDQWRNARHAFEAELFAALQTALGSPDDVAVPEMLQLLIRDRDRLREALHRIYDEIHSDNERNALGSCIEITRLAKAAIAPRGGQQVKSTYDTTIARMAGNIAAGLVTKPDSRIGADASVTDVQQWVESIAMLSVLMAIQIVVQTKALAPREEPR